MIVPTRVSRLLAERIGRIMEERVVLPLVKEFRDGELYVRIPEEDERIVVIGSTHQPDRNWVELLLLVDAAKRITDSVEVIIPYFGYGRQDKVFLRGEPVSAEVFGRALPVERFASVEPHFARRIGTHHLFGKEVHSLSAAEVIGKFLKERGVDIIVAPDEGANDLVERVNKVLGGESVVFHKERDRYSGRVRLKGERVGGEVVAIVDDIIGSGATMLMASGYVEAKKVLFVGVHGVFSPGWERLKEKGEVIVTDTIQRKESVVSVAEVISNWLKSLP